MMTIDKAFKFGFAFGKGYRYSLKKRGMAMDSWVTLQNKEGENYRVDLPGENPNGSGNKSKRSKIDGMSEKSPKLLQPKKADSKKSDKESLIAKMKQSETGQIEHNGRKYWIEQEWAGESYEQQAENILKKDEEFRKRDAEIKELIKGRPGKLPEKQKYLRVPVKVSRETEKAVAIPNPVYESAKESINESKNRGARQSAWMNLSDEEREAWKNKKSLLWLPKSRTTIKDGVVYGTEPWIARNGRLIMDYATDSAMVINSMLEM